MTFSNLFFALDAWFIAPYRWVAQAQAAFLFGTLILAIQSLLVGRLCLLVLNKAQQHLRIQYDGDVDERQRLSLQAITAQNKTAYLAQNDLAQEAYGRSMSLAMGRLCASLWPAVMSLAWMKSRFSDAPFPIPLWFSNEPPTLSYAVVFIFFFICILFASNRMEAQFTKLSEPKAHI